MYAKKIRIDMRFYATGSFCVVCIVKDSSDNRAVGSGGCVCVCVWGGGAVSDIRARVRAKSD